MPAFPARCAPLYTERTAVSHTAQPSATVVAEGHLIDSQLLTGIFDLVIERGGAFEVLAFAIGRTNDEFSRLIASNVSLRSVLKKLGLSHSPGNYRTLHRRIRVLQLSTAHMLGKAHGSTVQKKKRAIEELLVLNPTIPVASSMLRARLISAGLLENRCAKCGIGPEWDGEPITLQLDHIDGNPADNRFENLRILCPNCHSQVTSRTVKRHAGRYLKTQRKCLDCETPVFKTAKRCVVCAGKQRQKIAWPTYEELATEVARSSYRAVAKRLGLSDAAIKRRLRQSELVPRVGYDPTWPE